jgi:hypothetical protein
MDKDIGKINKGEFQGTVTDIVVGVKEYNGRVGIDIREFSTSEKYTGPTKKGLRIPAKNFQEFKDMINSISEADLAEPAAPQEGVPSDEGKKEAPTEQPADIPPEQETLGDTNPDY